jgi:hypothetical protein
LASTTTAARVLALARTSACLGFGLLLWRAYSTDASRQIVRARLNARRVSSRFQRSPSKNIH